MSDEQGRPPVAPGTDEAGYERPPGVADGFAPRAEPPGHTAPPPPASAAEQAVFGRPGGAGAFAPAPGERIEPQHATPAPVPPLFAETYGPTPSAVDGFDPPPGVRIEPQHPTAPSPWWKADALKDPWRDPRAPYWLGRGALFSRGEFAQRAPEEDIETSEEDLVRPEEPQAPAGPVTVRPSLRLVVFAALGALLIGALGGVIGYFFADAGTQALHRSDVSIAQLDKPVVRAPGSVAGIAKRVGPAVVSIYVDTAQGAGVGSGVVVDRHGYVLTNNHVVANATKIVVVFSDESTADARIVGRDPVSDLAVVQVPDDKLTVATLGNSDLLAVGDPVIAIGSPHGLNGTVTAGIVSALHRPVPVQNEDGSTDAVLDAIQTDAPINPGNSGGALVNAAGAVVGINSAAALGDSNGISFSGLGFAIPINYARTIATELIRTGKAVHGSLGVQGHTAQSGIHLGAALVQVAPGGAADKAGLKAGDVVVAADDRVTQSYETLQVVIQEHKPGDKVKLTYYRGSSRRSVTVTLDKA